MRKNTCYSCVPAWSNCTARSASKQTTAITSMWYVLCDPTGHQTARTTPHVLHLKLSNTKVPTVSCTTVREIMFKMSGHYSKYRTEQECVSPALAGRPFRRCLSSVALLVSHLRVCVHVWRVLTTSETCFFYGKKILVNKQSSNSNVFVRTNKRT